jgi:hypothetical protein
MIRDGSPWNGKADWHAKTRFSELRRSRHRGGARVGERAASDRFGIASIGAGTRGIYLLREFQRVPGVEIRVPTPGRA